MCLACSLNIGPRAPDVGTTEVISGAKFNDLLDPDPAMVEQFGPYGCIRNVILCRLDGHKEMATGEVLEKIRSEASALVIDVVDSTVYIWAIQYKK